MAEESTHAKWEENEVLHVLAFDHLDDGLFGMM